MNSGATMRTARGVGSTGTQGTVDIGGGQLVAAPHPDSYIPLLRGAVQVQAGQSWTAATWWQAYADGVTTPMVTPLVELHLVFQANATDAYPTAVQDNTLMQGVGPFGSMPLWAILRDPTGTGRAVPAG